MKRLRFLSLIVALSFVGSILAYWWNDWCLERHLSVARSALMSRDTKQALAALEAAAQVDPASSEVQFWMARAHRRRGRLNDVHRYLQRANQLGISKSRILREEWLAMAQAGQMAEAELHLSELLFNPNDDGPDICEAYANGYLVSHRYSEAFAIVDAWQKDYPKDPQPHVFRGMVANINSSWKMAAEHFQTALDLAPQRDDIRLQLANALLALRNTTEAASQFQQLLKSCPDDSLVQTGWGRTLLEMGQLDKAREIFAEALKAHPQDFDVLLALGQVELSANRLDEALPLLRQAVLLAPDDSEARNALANVLQRIGLTTEARSHFEFVAQAQETNARIQTLRERVSINSKDLDSRYELSELLRGNHNQTDRIQWLRSIIEIDPKHQRAQAALAEHYEKTGDTEMAARHRVLSDVLTRASSAVEGKP